MLTYLTDDLASALNSQDVACFFRSLDDNSVWHLYHFDQVP